MEGHHVLVKLSALIKLKHSVGRLRDGQIGPPAASVRHCPSADGEPETSQQVGNPEDADRQVCQPEHQAIALCDVDGCELLQNPHDPQHPHHANYSKQTPQLGKTQHLQAAASVARLEHFPEDQAGPIADDDDQVGDEPTSAVRPRDVAEIHRHLTVLVDAGEEVDGDVERPEHRRTPSHRVQEAGQFDLPRQHKREHREIEEEDDQAT
mmetsp:Transcript_81940/g.237632  ORF Transcript_81940/g.237632 Transcript_81940/m.237632 type:complete len:209 (+) Transcript_81940:661-1287(+)